MFTDHDQLQDWFKTKQAEANKFHSSSSIYFKTSTPKSRGTAVNNWGCVPFARVLQNDNPYTNRNGIVRMDRTDEASNSRAWFILNVVFNKFYSMIYYLTTVLQWSVPDEAFRLNNVRNIASHKWHTKFVLSAGEAFGKAQTRCTLVQMFHTKKKQETVPLFEYLWSLIDNHLSGKVGPIAKGLDSEEIRKRLGYRYGYGTGRALTLGKWGRNPWQGMNCDRNTLKERNINKGRTSFSALSRRDARRHFFGRGGRRIPSGKPFWNINPWYFSECATAGKPI